MFKTLQPKEAGKENGSLRKKAMPKTLISGVKKSLFYESQTSHETEHNHGHYYFL